MTTKIVRVIRVYEVDVTAEYGDTEDDLIEKADVPAIVDNSVPVGVAAAETIVVMPEDYA